MSGRVFHEFNAKTQVLACCNMLQYVGFAAQVCPEITTSVSFAEIYQN